MITLVGVDWLAVVFWGAVVSFLVATLALLACIVASVARWWRRRVDKW